VTREWVVFADTKTAPVEQFGGTELKARVLSKDTTGNTFSVVIDVPAGWQGPAPDRSRNQYEEIYVLSGDVQVADTELAAGDYRFCPPGQTLGGLRGSKAGARIFLKRGETDPTGRWSSGSGQRTWFGRRGGRGRTSRSSRC
jgi:glyoxylate utilization-related uncharacterized protein